MTRRTQLGGLRAISGCPTWLAAIISIFIVLNGVLGPCRKSNHLPNYRETGVEVDGSKYRWAKGNKVTTPFRASWGVREKKTEGVWKKVQIIAKKPRKY
jgi:hypothetical protein